MPGRDWSVYHQCECGCGEFFPESAMKRNRTKFGQTEWIYRPHFVEAYGVIPEPTLLSRVISLLAGIFHNRGNWRP